jgi:cytoskeleton protein RodZ
MSDVLATLGQRLKAEREKKGLSAQKAADELNLDGWVVDAMESGDYARVGPAVYAKGHLKRYAVLLGLPVTEILEAYETQSSPPSPMSQPSTVRMRTSAPTGSELPWIQIVGFAVLALVVGGVMWWKPWHFFGAAGAPVASVARAPTPASAAASAEAQGDSSDDGASAQFVADVTPAGPNTVAQSGAAGTNTGGTSAVGTSVAPSAAAGASARAPVAGPSSAASGTAPGAGRARQWPCEQRENHRGRGAAARVLEGCERGAITNQRSRGGHWLAVLHG